MSADDRSKKNKTVTCYRKMQIILQPASKITEALWWQNCGGFMQVIVMGYEHNTNVMNVLM